MKALLGGWRVQPSPSAVQAMMTEYDRGYVDGLAAMRAIFLRTGHRLIELGPLAYDRADDTVLLRGRRVHFPPAHRRLIELLLTGRLVTLDRAIPVLWPMGTDDIDADNLLSVHVCNLRKRLRELGAPRDVIVTQWGEGFRFNAQAVWACEEALPARLVQCA